MAFSSTCALKWRHRLAMQWPSFHKGHSKIVALTKMSEPVMGCAARNIAVPVLLVTWRLWVLLPQIRVHWRSRCQLKLALQTVRTCHALPMSRWVNSSGGISFTQTRCSPPSEWLVPRRWGSEGQKEAESMFEPKTHSPGEHPVKWKMTGPTPLPPSTWLNKFKSDWNRSGSQNSYKVCSGE